MKHSELVSVIEPYLPGMEDVDAVEQMAHSAVGSEPYMRAKEKVDQVVASLAAGVPYRRIAETFSVSFSTISKIKCLYPELLDQARKRLAGKYLMISEVTADQLLELAAQKKLPANLLAGISGIALDKSNVLSNRPTQITEKIENGKAEINGLRELLADLAKGKTDVIVDAEVVDD